MDISRTIQDCDTMYELIRHMYLFTVWTLSFFSNKCINLFQAALNMITKNLSLDLAKDGILATAVHPGWIQTDMGGPNATTTTQDCVKNLIGLMATFVNQSFNGKFYHFSGREMAW